MTNVVGADGALSPVCDQCERPPCGADGPTTVYVHLQDGDVVPVSGVTRLNVTDMSIVLMRGKKKPIIYPRSRVYYACCQKDMPPPQC